MISSAKWVVFLLFITLTGSLVLPQNAEQPQTVTIIGTIQSALGCSDDWQADCVITQLAYDPDDDLWSASFDLPAGSYVYKVARDDLIYGANAEQEGLDVSLVLSENTTVTFFYNDLTHWVTDSVNVIIANIPGNYQDEIGCPGEWQPDCLRSWLQDPDGDGVYMFETSAIPAGAYEAKVALNQSWDLNYGDQGAQNGANIGFTVPEDGTLVVFSWDSNSKIMTITAGGLDMSQIKGSLFTAEAIWVTADTILWDIARVPGSIYKLHFDSTGVIELDADGINGGEFIEVTFDSEGVTEAIADKFPHLKDYDAFKIAQEDLHKVRDILKGQIVISATDNQGSLVDATRLQIAGVLDDLYTYDGSLGVTFEDDMPTLRVWAPTARSVTLHLFEDGATDIVSTSYPMEGDAKTGIWSLTGEPDWTNQYYLYEVEVYVPSTGQVEHNLVTDPYSLSLSMNSTRSQIVNLTDLSLMPDGWEAYEKPQLDAPEDIVIYELHVRDFSIYDDTVPLEDRGTYRALTHFNSNGMKHLKALAEAGLTHIHLLPVFDIATINEDRSAQTNPDPEELASYAPDSDQQQAIVNEMRADDGFNWGYDPYHYTTPEGSYATQPEGTARIREFREMVQALNSIGLRVVMDVVYNHTNASGQNDKSVLDKIVPGYYHRLNPEGNVETSTCCQNTATEHHMMEKLMIDSLVTWATAYKVDGFRFDLMGHHMRENIENVRVALDTLTLDEHGVDGEKIYIYGEGWNFGEVADEARGLNATQLNMAGTGIGTFNDRLRDAVRGGGPFAPKAYQGFITGLFYEPNGTEQVTDDEQSEQGKLLLYMDQIRVGLAGNLADYSLESSAGEQVTGWDIDYNGAPTGYTLDPQENIVYIAAHDNETLFDAIQQKAAPETTIQHRVRMNNLGLSLVALSQGVPFFHAGDDLLRSKSMDRDSYDSGDWFNRLDFSYTTNNWGVGLPIADKNQDLWPLMQPLLADPALKPGEDDILASAMHLREMLQIRKSSPLFRLRTAEEVQACVRFWNTNQTPGLIAMVLDDTLKRDANYQMMVLVFNALPETQTVEADDLSGINFELHPVQVDSRDDVVKNAVYDAETNTFSVPGRTTAVFVARD